LPTRRKADKGKTFKENNNKEAVTSYIIMKAKPEAGYTN